MDARITRMVGKMAMSFYGKSWENMDFWIDELRKMDATVDWADEMLPCYQLRRTFTVTHQEHVYQFSEVI
jgi:hypothetical protein